MAEAGAAEAGAAAPGAAEAGAAGPGAAEAGAAGAGTVGAGTEGAGAEGAGPGAPASKAKMYAAIAVGILVVVIIVVVVVVLSSGSNSATEDTSPTTQKAPLRQEQKESKDALPTALDGPMNDNKESKKTAETVTVTTPLGNIVGERKNYDAEKTNLKRGNGIQFLGVPFANPPVGEMRFKRPAELNKFPSDPFVAQANGNICPQWEHKKRSMNEDCLFLNIYTPDVKPAQPYPVMVYIHGGSMQTGSCYDVPHQAAFRNFVSKNVTLVTIQYRLGLLGFFTTFTEDFPPNLGMLDQVAAIKFVNKYISHFGGDPNQVTIFGESAGGASVAAHLMSPLSQNLFKQAIIESASVLTTFDGALGFINNSYVRANMLCQMNQTQWKAGNYQVLKDCFAKIPIENIVGLDRAVKFGWQIVRDNEFMPDLPQNLYKKRNNIPVIYGSCKDEAAAFLFGLIEVGIINIQNITETTLFEMMGMFTRIFYDAKLMEVVSYMKSQYLGAAENSYGKVISDIGTGQFFTGFIRREINWYMEMNNTQVYVYEMTYPSAIAKAGLGPPLGFQPVVYHTCELPFIFLDNERASPDDIAVADFFADAWTTFARTGKPAAEAVWPPTNGNTYQYLDINIKQNISENYRDMDNKVFNEEIPKKTDGIRPPEELDTTDAELDGLIEFYKKLAAGLSKG